ncbi:MAG: DUF2490 domain-containing protein [Nitrosopumilaceae archaeon]
MIRKIFSGFLLFMTTAVPSAVFAEDDMQAWFPIKAQGHVTDKVLWSMELETRLFDNMSEFGSQSAAPAIGYQLNDNWSVWQGFKWEGKYDSLNDTWNHEYRPYQQLNASYKLFDNVTFKTRTRFEERNFANGDDFSFRMRQLFRGEYALTDRTYLAASEELFFNLNDTIQRPDGFSQNRIFGGFGYKVTDNATIETGYMRRFDEGFIGPDKDTNIWVTTLGFSF